MLRFFYPVQVFQQGKTITVRRIYAKKLDRDLQRVFGQSGVDTFPLMYITERKMFERVLHISIHEFFAPELYEMFKLLYEKTKRRDYYEVCELLTTNTWLRSINNEVSVDPAPLSQLKKQLLPHQMNFATKEYFEAKVKMLFRGCLLGFDQGTGKTYTSLGVAWLLKKQTFVFCQDMAVFNWVSEIKEIIPGNPSIGVVGKSDPNQEYDFVVCNYEKTLRSFPFVKREVTMIIDETQNVRYLATNRAQELITFREKTNCTDVIPMSGTPVKGLAVELLPMVKLLDPRLDDTAQALFIKLFSKYRSFAYKILRFRLQFMMDRVMKEDVLTLPPKHYDTIKLKVSNPDPYTMDVVKKDMRAFASERYRELVKDRKLYYIQFDDVIDYCHDQDVISWLEAFQTKRTLRNLVKGDVIQNVEDPSFAKFQEVYVRCYTFLTRHDKEMRNKLKEARSATVGAIMKAMGEAMGQVFMKRAVEVVINILQENPEPIIKIVQSADKKVIFFTKSLKVVEYVQTWLSKTKIGCISITGATSNVGEEIDKFKHYDDVDVLVATIQKLSTAVNLVVANTVLFLDLPYRSADYKQAQDRVYRLGQDTDVFIISMYLDTGSTPNLTTHTQEILEWSRDVSEALYGKDAPPDNDEELQKIYDQVMEFIQGVRFYG